MAASVWIRALATLAGLEPAQLELAKISRTPQLVIALDSLELLQPKPVCELVALAAAAPQAIRGSTFRVRGLTVVAGPYADGITPNATTIFLGDQAGVTKGQGFPLGPGDSYTFGAVDLADLWITGATPGDVLRLIYLV